MLTAAARRGGWARRHLRPNAGGVPEGDTGVLVEVASPPGASLPILFAGVISVADRAMGGM